MDAIGATLDQAILTPVVRRVLACATADLDAWRVDPIAYLNLAPQARALYRVAGTAHTGDTTAAWSVVLKVLRAPADPARAAPDHPFFWRREPLLFQSGLLADLAGGWRAPGWYGVTERPDGAVWLWLEDLAALDDRPWSVARYGLAAAHLGRFGGAYLAERSVPTAAWLSRGLIRAWVEDSAGLIPLIRRPDVWEHPLLRRAFAPSPAAAVLRLWEERDQWFRALERRPQTFCHHDVWRQNLFAGRGPAGEEETIAIDWELAGPGAVGEDAGNLLGVSLLNLDITADQAPALEEAILTGYLAGLQAAGRPGEPGGVRAAIGAAAALRCVFSTAGWPVAIVLDASGQYVRDTEARWGRPIEVILAQWAATTALLLDRAAAARAVLQPA